MHENSRSNDQERQHRQDAVDHARASVCLSGFVLSQAAEALFARYVLGDFSSDELTAQVLVLGRARTPEADEGLLTANRIRELFERPVGRRHTTRSHDER